MVEVFQGLNNGPSLENLILKNTRVDCLYRREIGSWKEHQEFKASNGSDGDKFGKNVAISGKTWLLEHSLRIMAMVMSVCQCTYLRHREKHGWKINN